MNDEITNRYPFTLFNKGKVKAQLLKEWTTRFQDLQNSKLPYFCMPIQWGSDFNHGQQWWVAPVLINPGWTGLTSYQNRSELARLNNSLSLFYPQTHKALSYLQKNNRIHYAAFSILFPNSILAYHKHNNPNHRKFLCLMHPTNRCGLMHTRRSSSGKPVKTIHHWKETGEWLMFNDNDYHSAWNLSTEPRTVLLIVWGKDCASKPVENYQ